VGTARGGHDGLRGRRHRAWRCVAAPARCRAAAARAPATHRQTLGPATAVVPRHRKAAPLCALVQIAVATIVRPFTNKSDILCERHGAATGMSCSGNESLRRVGEAMPRAHRYWIGALAQSAIHGTADRTDAAPFRPPRADVATTAALRPPRAVRTAP